MRIQEFIDALERRDVVGGDLARKLRAKVAQDNHRITPDAVLKYLVKKDVITGQQAEELELSLLSVLGGGESEILNLMPLPDAEEEDEVEKLTQWSLEEEAAAVVHTGPYEPGEETPPPFAPPPAFSRSAPTADDEFFVNQESAPVDPRALDAGAKGRMSSGVYRLGGDKKKGKKRTAGGKSQWDSPLLLIGGGALVVLVVAGLALYYLLFRETADAVLTDANNLVRSGAYSQAITRYEDFVKRFSSHSDISQAKVKLEMTRLWQAVDGGGDPVEAVAVAKTTIDKIADEPAFISDGDSEEGLSEAKQDFSVLLVRLGKALVKQAEAETDPDQVAELVKQIQAVLDLSENDKFVPEKLRNVDELKAMREALVVIASRQQREGDLTAALAKMDAAVASGETAAAYKARLDLLANYPALADDAALAAKVKEVSAAEQAAVKFIAGDQSAETTWPPRAVVAELALAERRTAAGAAAGGDPVVVRIDGALYGLASGDGALLWRRFAGLGETGSPLALADGGVVAADLHGGELWRLDAKSGKLVWRLPVGGKIAGVVAAGQRLLATSDAGNMLVVDAGSGTLVGRVEFSQPIRTAPVVNDRGNRIYVVAEHSVLYTLSAENYSCVGVYYLGHAPGAVIAPPVTVLDKLIVADNLGGDACRLRVLAVDESGAVAGDAAGDRLTGRVVTPLSTAGRRIAAATTQGQLAVFDVSGAADQSALSPVARRDGQDRDEVARFGLLQQGHFWVAGRELVKLAILPTENQLTVAGIDDDFQGDAFDAPLTVAGDLVIHVRRPVGRGGAVVSATSASSGQTSWETEVAVPLAGMAAGGALQLSAITASGAAYLLDRDAMIRGVQDKASRATIAGRLAPLTEAVDLGEGRLAAGAIGGNRITLFSPVGGREVVRTIDLAGPLSCALVAWRGGFVAPTDVGQVFLFDADAGESLATPFQPELTPDRQYKWLAPAVAGEGDRSRLLLSDGAEHLHAVEFVAAPAPHLVATMTVDVGPSPLASPLAVVGEKAYAGTEDGRLAAFALPELSAQEPAELGGRVAWGPFAVGDGVLLATDAGELMMVDGDGAVRWRRTVKHGALSGKPLAEGATALVLHGEGGVSQINLAEGKEAGFVELGQPAIVGPLVLGERLVVAAPDGALLVVNRP